MVDSNSARTTPRRIPGIFVVGLVFVSVAIGAAVGYEVMATPSSTAASSSVPPRTDGPDEGKASGPAPIGTFGHRNAARGALGESDGVIPRGTTVFDDQIRGVANLEPDLLAALREAANDAAAYGIEVFVDSGWRSPAYQQQLLHDAVGEYGSQAEAARWVATPSTSAHVSGDAVDLGPAEATVWLSENGAEYGLCQIYRNEPWHFELRREAIDQGCPPMYADPAHDPRMQH